MTEPAPLEGDELLAAEYVLGLLEGEALLDARARLARGPDFAELVLVWEERLAPLLDEFGTAEPSAATSRAILDAFQTDSAPSAEIVALRHRERRWRWTASVTSAAAALAIAFLATDVLQGPATPQPEPTPVETEAPAPLMASLTFADAPQRLGVTWLPQSGELLVSADGLAADGVHDHELWLIPPDGDPQSLGVVQPGQQVRRRVADDLARQLGDGSQLALSREPLGGKPPEADVGPVVASGALSTT